MAKVRVLVNTRLNRVFYGRDSVVEVSPKEAEHLVSLGLVEILYAQKVEETPEQAEKVEEIEQPEAEKPKAKAKKAVKK